MELRFRVGSGFGTRFLVCQKLRPNIQGTSSMRKPTLFSLPSGLQGFESEDAVSGDRASKTALRVIFLKSSAPNRLNVFSRCPNSERGDPAYKMAVRPGLQFSGARAETVPRMGQTSNCPRDCRGVRAARPAPTLGAGCHNRRQQPGAQAISARTRFYLHQHPLEGHPCCIQATRRGISQMGANVEIQILEVGSPQVSWDRGPTGRTIPVRRT